MVEIKAKRKNKIFGHVKFKNSVSMDNSDGAESCSLIYILSVAAFAPEW